MKKSCPYSFLRNQRQGQRMVQMAGLRLCSPYGSELHILKMCLPIYSFGHEHRQGKKVVEEGASIDR